ncbi:MAG: ribbon-helix-helix domain-containing protein [Phycisphaerales bacterium]|nr:ribbon-helix-helix domain-containing protein [Phycisphaerales bacterium]
MPTTQIRMLPKTYKRLKKLSVSTGIPLTKLLDRLLQPAHIERALADAAASTLPLKAETP